MKAKVILTLFLALTAFSSGLYAQQGRYQESMQTAVDLYKDGSFARAKDLFEALPSGPISRGYSLLCAIKLRQRDYPKQLALFEHDYPTSALLNEIYWENARVIFDEARYAEASREFARVDDKALRKSDLPEYLFKCAYSEYIQDRYPEALPFFERLESQSASYYTAPGRYLTGVIYYNNSDFAVAEGYFKKAVEDPRFKDLASFYIVDCEFNQKNYSFVTSEGEKIYATAPEERRERLARIISESHLILGNADKAREFYNDISHETMNRKDYFYAASVMYAEKDYQGAIDNFTRMTDRTDSLGQLANYQLANSYIHTRNQVAAMQAFLDASKADFDPEITEDASFNYAKLAFDLNKDTSGFADYIKRYSTKKKGVIIYSYMALAALYDKDYAGAVAAYDNIDELESDMWLNYTKANFLRGEQLFSRSSYRDAVPYFKATAYYLPKTDPLNQLARFYQGESYYRNGAYSDAEKIFTELYNNSALDGSTQGELLSYNIACSQFAQGDFESAARWFDTYLSSEQQYSDAETLQACHLLSLERRADCDFARKEYKTAIPLYQKIIDECDLTLNFYPQYQKALAQGLLKDNKGKVATLLKVKDERPEAYMYNEAFYELGRTQIDLKRYSDAVQTFSTLRDITSDLSYKAKALIGEGLAYRNMNNYDKALESYKEAVSLMKGSDLAGEALLAIESIYQKTKHPEKYLQYVEENGLGTGSSDAEREKMYFSTAEQLYLAENYETTITTVQKFLETYPESQLVPQAQFYLAESYAFTGENEKAVEAYSKAMTSDSELSFAEMAKSRYASLSYELQRFADAYTGYSLLYASSKIDANKTIALEGMMRSAFKDKSYEDALKAVALLESVGGLSADQKREIKYIKAKSSLATSRRDEAMKLFAELSKDPTTAEGAEARYMTIQDLYDRAVFASVESEVYSFAQKASNQSYWLAKAYLVLGDSFVERGQYEQAKATYESIRDGYTPSSSLDDVPDNVTLRLERLESLTNKQ